MTRKFTLTLFCITLFSASSIAQRSYFATGGEMIFSYGEVATDSTEIKPVVRWSPVFCFQVQYHYDFSKNAGIYTGIGLRNVGLISHVTTLFFDQGSQNLIQREITVKERSYALGIPLAFQFGNLEKGPSAAIGAEAELMFAYKRKIIDEDGKQKDDGWFDDRVNLFNPSAFAEVHFTRGQYIRFKYYLMDFLNYKGINLVDRNLNQTFVADYGSESPLFYISLGSTIVSHKKTSTSTSGKTSSAFFKDAKEKSPELLTGTSE